ncbi:helix-turn-helix domain-containing protein [Paraburkholderia heleia]|uniref:helix-turn-helix domain-containing protein n=1 Tax=Paraburkholderia heleia TaxID=634127 RepID=UPI0005A5D8E1|nr:helix-turn-helix domain-containing protein [Paraburkholderia heleia]
MPNTLSLMSSLRDVASRINTDDEVDTLLHSLIELACRHGSWDLGSIMSVDAAHGDALVIARRDTALLKRPLSDRWELATSPALVALQRNEAVYIRDALETTEFLGYRREAAERGYRTVLVLPMACHDVEGRPMVLVVLARKIVDLPAEQLAFMELIVHLGAIAIERTHRQRAQQAAAAQLRRVVDVQGAMLEEVLAGGSMVTLTAMLADLLDSPVLVIDLYGGELHASRAPHASLDMAAWRAGLDGDAGQQIRAAALGAIERHALRRVPFDLPDGLTLHANVELLSVDGDTVGALLCFGEREPGDLHTISIENAKFAMSVQLMRSVIRFRSETRTLAELFFEIVERRWRDEQDVLERARRLGLVLAAPARLLVIDYPHRSGAAFDRSAECHRAANMLAVQHKLAIHPITVGNGFVCVLPDAPAQTATAFARQLCGALGALLCGEPTLVVSDAFTGLTALANEWERCWRMIRVARAFGKTGALSVPDLGPLPMLIGAADSSDVRAFIAGTIGRIVEYDAKHHASYIGTLATYIRHGCRAQACADAMGLHVTTLRYRLARIVDLFGIDVETPERRFAVELALQLHNLLDAGQPVGAASHNAD